jgi:hypothetical protein
VRHALLGLLLCLSAACASAAELKVATWNLEWLTDRPDGDPTLPHDAHPKRSDDIARLAAYATKLDADLIAIQEVDGRDIAARIFRPDRYAIYMTHDHVVQRVGLVVRRGLEYDTDPDLTTLAVSDHGRSFLRSGADITLHLPGGALRVLAVHLKALCERDPLTDSHRPACTVFAGAGAGPAGLDRRPRAGTCRLRRAGRFQPLDGRQRPVPRRAAQDRGIGARHRGR